MATLTITPVGAIDTATGNALATENGAPAQVLITRDGPTNSALTVFLGDGDPSETNAPFSVVIPAGQTSVVATIPAQDDNITDGRQSAPIVVDATGYDQVVFDVTVADDDLSDTAVTQIYLGNFGLTDPGGGFNSVSENASDLLQVYDDISAETVDYGVRPNLPVSPDNVFGTNPNAFVDDASGGFGGSQMDYILDGTTIRSTVDDTLRYNADFTMADGTVWTGVDVAIYQSKEGDVFLETWVFANRNLVLDPVNSIDGRIQTGQGGQLFAQPIESIELTEVTNRNLDGRILVSFPAETVPDEPDTGTVVGNVFTDTNGDNTEFGDFAFEPGIEGVTVLAKDLDGNILAAATTNSVGFYQLENVPAGDVIIEVPTQIDGQGLVTPNVGPESEDSDADPATGQAFVTVPAGAVLNEVDFGYTDAPDPLLTITPAPDAPIDPETGNPLTAENGAPAQIVIERNGPTDQPLVVTLTDGDPTETDAPATVTIPAGQSSITVDIPSVDDPIVDGPQISTITASAPGFPDATQDVTVADDDLPTITITPDPDGPTDPLTGNPLTAENGAPAQIVISRDGPTDQPLVVTLTDGDPTETDAPATVTIPAGQSSITVDIPSVDDPIVDGPQISTITASAPGTNPGTIDVTVADDDHSDADDRTAARLTGRSRHGQSAHGRERRACRHRDQPRRPDRSAADRDADRWRPDGDGCA